MSKEELQQRFDAAIAETAITIKDRLRAARFLFKRASAEGIDCALAGDLAMRFHGCYGATQDVTILASRTFNLEPVSQLSYGGERYSISGEHPPVMVDVIVRSDHLREFYTAALRDAKATTDGLRFLSPEWQVILKFLGGSSEDRFDLLVLLGKSGLVNRDNILRLVEQVDGKLSAHLFLIGLKPFYIQADVIRANDDDVRK